MAKKQVTRKEVAATHKTVLSVNYCALQNLLKYMDPFAYNAGNLGHNCDIYSLGPVAIVMGARPFGVPIARDTVRHYEARAIRINSMAFTHAEKREMLTGLIGKLIGDLTD